MPSSSLSWQQGLAGRNPAISFLTSAENEMPIPPQSRSPQQGPLVRLSPLVQSTEPVTLLARYQTMLMARAIERRLWVLDRMEGSPPRRAGRWREAPVGTYTHILGFEVVQVAAAAALRP